MDNSRESGDEVKWVGKAVEAGGERFILFLSGSGMTMLL
jgi:hypothetical protein